MQLQMNIEFDKLVQLAKQLPLNQWTKLKREVEKTQRSEKSISELEAFLLSAPTFSEKQLEEISKTREAISQWREN